MNRFENVADEVADRTTGETLSHLIKAASRQMSYGYSHPANLPDDGRLVAGYKPVMWFMALLLAVFVTGCGGGDGVSPASSAKAITSFSLAWNTGTPGTATGTINETATPKTIVVPVPPGTNLTALVATFTTTGASVKVGTTVQQSGISANDFTTAKTYIVTAADGTTATYTVTVASWFVDPLGADDGSHGAATGAAAFKTIQYAISDSRVLAGDTIQVAAGTYTEQISINKNLTIVGAGSATTIIQAPAVLTNDPDGAKDIVLFTGAITAEISGFTIAGPVNGLNFGIYVRDGATANIHDNIVKDIRDEPLSGNQYGYGIEIGKYNNSFPFVNQIGHATITNNTVFGYQKSGIEIEGATSTGTITGNTVTGAGATTTTAQNGIQIRRGATGSIINNTVTGNAYILPLSCDPSVSFNNCSTAGGIIVTYPGNDVIVQGNTVNNNTANIYTYEATGIQILNNQVSDSAVGLTSAGITVDSDNVASSTAGISGVTISGNTVHNNLSDGIFLWGIKNSTVSNNTIDGSGYDGIMIGASGNITITGNTFFGNGLLNSDSNTAAIDFGGVYHTFPFIGFQPNSLGGFSVHENSIDGNRNGVWNYDSASVNATNNWWGSASGPYHATLNPSGTGNAISNYVGFTPWLTVAP